MKAKINATIHFIPHPDPKRSTDLWAQLIVNEIFKREAESAAKGDPK